MNQLPNPHSHEFLRILRSAAAACGFTLVQTSELQEAVDYADEVKRDEATPTGPRTFACCVLHVAKGAGVTPTEKVPF